MPVRSLNSYVLRWVPKDQVIKALMEWAKEVYSSRSDVVKIGYFGSYARGDWGVGSDLDVIVLLRGSSLPFWKRCLEFDTTDLPVPVDLIVYTLEEVEKLKGTKFYEDVIAKEVIWIELKDNESSSHNPSESRIQ